MLLILTVFFSSCKVDKPARGCYDVREVNFMAALTPPLLFDGATGTALLARGLRFDCPERLNLTHPDAVLAVHRAYVEAGADVVETNTLGANPLRLRAFGLEAKCERITEAAVLNARASGARFVACSVGTTLAYGSVSDDELLRAFARQMRAAARAGADLIFCETLTCLSEARLMFAAARETQIPFAASFFFGSGGTSPSGDMPRACAQAAQEAGASLVGLNCINDAAIFLPALREMRDACTLPLVAQPGAGLPSHIISPQSFAALIAEALRVGASCVGGCCGTTPAHIRRIAPMLHRKGDYI